jgi:hypothetical protein
MPHLGFTLETAYDLAKHTTFEPLLVAPLLWEIGALSGSQPPMAVEDYGERVYGLGKVDVVGATWTWPLEKNQQDTISGLLEQLYP